MLCLLSPTTDVYRNLATEEYLLKQTQADVCMLWQTDNAVVIGKNQNLTAEVNLNFANQKNIRLARRFSGGGAVYQDMGNLNLTFIRSACQIDFTHDLNRVIRLLTSVGIQAEADERLSINVGGLKVSGSAQCVHKNRIMYHCTLLFDTDLDLLNASLAGSNPNPHKPLTGTSHVRAVASVHSPVVNLKQLMPHPTHSTAAFVRHVFDYFLHEDATTNTLYRLNADELQAIESLRNRKYIQKAWICHRSEA